MKPLYLTATAAGGSPRALGVDAHAALAVEVALATLMAFSSEIPAVCGPGEVEPLAAHPLRAQIHRAWVERVRARGGEDLVAYLVRGPVNGDVSASDSEAILLGEEHQDEAGSSVAGLGDASGEGSRTSRSAPGTATGAALNPGWSMCWPGPSRA